MWSDHVPSNKTDTNTTVIDEKDTREHYCNSSACDEPPQVKEAWPFVEDDNIEDSDCDDTMDNDSGIDRSDDFTEEILNES